MGIEEIVCAPRSPWQNPYCERLIGSIRRECLNHIIMLHERHLRRILRSYFVYYHQSRTHLSVNCNSPMKREVERPEEMARSLRFRKSAVYNTGIAAHPKKSPVRVGWRSRRGMHARAYPNTRIFFTQVHWIGSTEGRPSYQSSNQDRRNVATVPDGVFARTGRVQRAWNRLGRCWQRRCLPPNKP